MLKVSHLSKQFFRGKELLNVVDDVSFTLEKGKVLGLIGESGCGKSTLAKMILRLIPSSSGKIYFDGEEIINKQTKRLAQRMQIVFQDPFSSLNPLMTIEKILKEPTSIHGLPHRVEELLDLVKLSSALKTRYPHELSGGQRQRIGIARALALKPDLLVCDEPVSSLDLPIQAQILNLLMQLKTTLGLTLLFISHDMDVIRYVSDKVIVMKQGKITKEYSTLSLCIEELYKETTQKTSLCEIPHAFQT